MNRHERAGRPGDEAKLRYLDGDFQVLTPGTYVRCAVTGRAIPLAELRYWNVDTQEAYADAAAAYQAFLARSESQAGGGGP
jgi:hypothetical protein